MPGPPLPRRGERDREAHGVLGVFGLGQVTLKRPAHRVAAPVHPGGTVADPRALQPPVAHLDHDLPSHFHGHSGGGGAGGSHYQQHLSQFAMTHGEVGRAADADFRPFDDTEDTDVDHRFHPHQPQLDLSVFGGRATVEDAVVFADEDDIASHFSQDDPFADVSAPAPAADFELPDPPLAPAAEAAFGSFDAFADFDNFSAGAAGADETATLPPPPPAEAE